MLSVFKVFSITDTTHSNFVVCFRNFLNYRYFPREFRCLFSRFSQFQTLFLGISLSVFAFFSITDTLPLRAPKKSGNFSPLRTRPTCFTSLGFFVTSRDASDCRKANDSRKTAARPRIKKAALCNLTCKSQLSSFYYLYWLMRRSASAFIWEATSQGPTILISSPRENTQPKNCLLTCTSTLTVK